MRLLLLGSLAVCRVIAQVDDDDEVLLRHLSQGNSSAAGNATGGAPSASASPSASGSTTDTNATAHHASASAGNATAGAPGGSASASGGNGTQPVASASASSLTSALTNGTSPVTAAPVTDAPVTDAPVTDAPVTDAPVTDAPGTDGPVTDAPVTDGPVTKGPDDGGPVTDGPVTRKPINSELCTADNYAAHGLAPPATIGTLDETKLVFVHCSGSTLDSPVVAVGANAVTEAQCTGAKGTFMKQTCKDVTGADKYGLMYCCGHSPSYIMESVTGNTMVSGTVKVEGFTDTKCATPATTIPAEEAYKVGKTHTMAECQPHPAGYHFVVSSCNGTAANSMFMTYVFYDSSCAHPASSSIENVGCSVENNDRRLADETAQDQMAAAAAQAQADQDAAKAALEKGDPSGLTPTQKIYYDSLKAQQDVLAGSTGAAAQAQADQDAAKAALAKGDPSGLTPTQKIYYDSLKAQQDLLAGSTDAQAAAVNSASGNGTTTASSGTAKLGSTKVTCEGQVATEKVFTAIVDVDFDIPADIKPAEVAAIKTVYEKESTDKFTASVAVAEAKIDAMHTYTGKLKSGRRLSVRRKLSTEKATASSTFSATVPAAKADQASKAVQDAATGGALNPDTFKAALETAFAADPALANVNITASPKAVEVSAPVAVPVTPSAPGGGSTSSAFESCLGAVVGALAGVMLLF